MFSLCLTSLAVDFDGHVGKGELGVLEGPVRGVVLRVDRAPLAALHGAVYLHLNYEY